MIGIGRWNQKAAAAATSEQRQLGKHALGGASM
jgi:hypothetical protein